MLKTVKEMQVLLSTIPQIIKFCIVGSIAAGIHLLILAILVHRFGLVPYFANPVAFIIAFVFSYWGQSQWTFQSADQKTTWQSVLRFLCIQVLCSFLLNQSGFFLLNSVFGWHYLLASTLVLIIIPVCTFMLTKCFVFKA